MLYLQESLDLAPPEREVHVACPIADRIDPTLNKFEVVELHHASAATVAHWMRQGFTPVSLLTTRHKSRRGEALVELCYSGLMSKAVGEVP